MLPKYEFRYPLSNDETKARLERAIIAANAEITAEFSDDGVKVYRDGGFLYNSFNPVFVGKLSGQAAGTVLTGYFRFHAFIIVFVACLLAASIYHLVGVLGLPEHVPGHVEGWKSERLAFELEFLGLVVLIPIVGWLIGLRSRNLLLSVLKDSTSER